MEFPWSWNKRDPVEQQRRARDGQGQEQTLAKTNYIGQRDHCTEEQKAKADQRQRLGSLVLQRMRGRCKLGIGTRHLS